MSKGKIIISGLDELFTEQIKTAEQDIDVLLNKVALHVRNHAKASSSFIDRTGNLRQSIRKQKSKYDKGGYIVVATGKNSSDFKGYHAHLVEKGHRMVLWGLFTGGFVPAHEFMEPARVSGEAYAQSLAQGYK